jgi:hypothetical protein
MAKITKGPSIMLKGTEVSIFGIWSAHGGRRYCPNPKILSDARRQGLTPIPYVDDEAKVIDARASQLEVRQ